MGGVDNTLLHWTPTLPRNFSENHSDSDGDGDGDFQIDNERLRRSWSCKILINIWLHDCRWNTCWSDYPLSLWSQCCLLTGCIDPRDPLDIFTCLLLHQPITTMSLHLLPSLFHYFVFNLHCPFLGMSSVYIHIIVIQILFRLLCSMYDLRESPQVLYWFQDIHTYIYVHSIYTYMFIMGIETSNQAPRFNFKNQCTTRLSDSHEAKNQWFCQKYSLLLRQFCQNQPPYSCMALAPFFFSFLLELSI